MSVEFFGYMHYKKGLPYTGEVDLLVQEEEYLYKKGLEYKNKKDLTVWLYVLEDTLNPDTFKIGISNHTYSRISQINRQRLIRRFNHKFKLLDHFFVGNRDLAEVYERSLILQFKTVYKRAVFEGATEVCYSY